MIILIISILLIISVGINIFFYIKNKSLSFNMEDLSDEINDISIEQNRLHALLETYGEHLEAITRKSNGTYEDFNIDDDEIV